ncbi:MAG: hypothetical protein R3C05_02225 [Pirellulaceae bacterium]
MKQVRDVENKQISQVLGKLFQPAFSSKAAIIAVIQKHKAEVVVVRMVIAAIPYSLVPIISVEEGIQRG